MCSSPNLNWVPNWNQSNFNCERKPKYFGVWSLDRMALDRTTRSKVSNNFGTRSKVCFGTRLKVSNNFGTRSKVFKV
jgi:hypothetical protein